ncbi:MAG: ribosomal protein S18-alanine N-acetyltransferase [Acidimicrobiales bacterium]
MDGIAVTQMHRRDLRAVLDIEKRVFPEPWSSSVFASELALRHVRSYRIARLGRKTIGYRGLMLGEEAHVTTLAVAPEHQRKGVATLLLLDAVSTAIESGAISVSLEVAFSNGGAQALYRRFGFSPVGVRKRYYQLTGEDAYVMFVREVDRPEYRQRIAAIEEELRRRPAVVI